VIIHENRFTYQQKGLHKIVDLGEVWETKQNIPIPLGCIAIKKELPKAVQQKVDGLIRKSLDYSFKNYPQVSEYVKQHAQEMNEDVMRKHIELYVNNYSLDLGEDGKRAIEQLHSVYSIQTNKKGYEKTLFV